MSRGTTGSGEPAPAPRRRAEHGGEPDLLGRYLAEIGSIPLLTAAEEVQLAKRVEAGVYAEALLRGAVSATSAQGVWNRCELAMVAADGWRAREHMIRANLRLVVAIVRRSGRRDLPFLDAVQEGNLGLMRAVEKFDYTKGYKFSTYATWWIRQALGRGAANQARTIRVPVHVAEQLTKLRHIDRDLTVRLDRDPTIDELAAAARMPASRVAELAGVGQDPVSLDLLLGEDGNRRIADLIEDTDARSVSDITEHQALVHDVRAAVAALPTQGARVIALRYGLSDGQPRTLREIGELLNLTRERIRQIEMQALEQLRQPEQGNRLLAWAG